WITSWIGPGLSRPAEEAQARDAAVRVDVEADVRRVADRIQLLLEPVPRVRLQRHPRQQLAPRGALAEDRRRLAAARLEAARPRRVPLEMTRVDLVATDGPLGAEPDDRPVVAGTAPPLRLPPVAHLRSVARHDQVVPRPEEHVAARDDDAAVLGRG